VLVVTSDKCYRNNEWLWGYRENDPLGGCDPYSASKGCAELVTSFYSASFFPVEKYGQTHRLAMASARAGNVIGGGDWAMDRLVPDCIRAFMADEKIRLRSPDAIRPWQHVLEPLWGYLLLAVRLFDAGPAFSGGWNFAPLDRGDLWDVERVVRHLCELWGEGGYVVDEDVSPHEAKLLSLDATKALVRLGWRPHWNVAKALAKTLEWYQSWSRKTDVSVIRALLSGQIESYLEGIKAVNRESSHA
jgi:CDP-glucose 4,6-dehydratase